MTALHACDVYLVGSLAVPSDRTEDAMTTAAEALGGRLSALPDGEVGLRQKWAGVLGPATYARHPDLEPVAESSETAPLRRSDGPFGRRVPEYRPKIAADQVSFDGYLPYADAALESYETFKELKRDGKIDADVRFQVAVPTPYAGVASFFDRVEDWDGIYAAYLHAMKVDIDRILEKVPASELALQWDYCNEVVDILGAAGGGRELDEFSPWNPQTSAEEKFAVHTAPEFVRALSEWVPDEVRFGYHLCLGTWPQFPVSPIEDLTWIVRIANRLLELTPRRVDFLHLPAVEDAGRDYFAPLADLNAGDTRIFIGVAHHDGVEGIVRRGTAAREFLPDFGISHYCGYGRDAGRDLPALLNTLREGADRLAARRLASQGAARRCMPGRA